MQFIKNKNEERVANINAKAKSEYEDHLSQKELNRDTNFEARSNQMRMMRNKVKGNRVDVLGGGLSGTDGVEEFEDKGVQAKSEMVDAEVSNFRLAFSKSNQVGVSGFRL